MLTQSYTNIHIIFYSSTLKILHETNSFPFEISYLLLPMVHCKTLLSIYSQLEEIVRFVYVTKLFARKYWTLSVWVHTISASFKKIVFLVIDLFWNEFKYYHFYYSVKIYSPHSHHAFVTGSIPTFSTITSLKDSQQIAVME